MCLKASHASELRRPRRPRRLEQAPCASNCWTGCKSVAGAKFDEPDEARAELFAGLREQGRAADYSSQKELLDDLHKTRETDIFVASYQHMRRGNGPVESYAVWSKGVDTLLPVNAAAGALMQACELVPQRVRVREFPAAASIDALRRLQPANAEQ